MKKPIREAQRFCTCGFSVTGEDHERRAALAEHRRSGEHQKRIDAANLRAADELFWADLETRAEES